VHQKQFLFTEFAAPPTAAHCTAIVEAVNVIFVNDSEEIHEEGESHHRNSIFLIIDDDALQNTVGIIIDEIVRQELVKLLGPLEIDGMPSLNSVGSILKVGRPISEVSKH
jgi:hypothetical protein